MSVRLCAVSMVLVLVLAVNTQAEVRFFVDFNGNTTDQVSAETGTTTGTLDGDEYVAFNDGRNGLGFDAADVRRIWYPITIADPDYIAFGCTIRKTVAFDSAAAAQRILTIAKSTDLTGVCYRLEFNATADGIYVSAFDTGNGNSSRSLAVTQFFAGVGDELTLAAVVMPDPGEPTGSKRLFRFYCNGYCIFSENRAGTEFPSEGLNQIYIGATPGVVSADCGAVVRDVWVIDGEHVQDYAMLRIHQDGFSGDAIAARPTLYREAYSVPTYSRTELTYPVEAVNAGRLWGHDSGEVYYTDDQTGVTGWTRFNTASPGTMQSVYAVGDYVFASVPGHLYRSAIATPSWSEVLALTGGDQYQVPGWSWTHRVDGAQIHLVIGEYKTAAGESRILHTADFGDNWDTCYTCAAGATHHIHAVFYNSEGRLWADRGDTADNVGYSDDDGATWTWFFDEADHHAGSQLIGMAESSTHMFGGIDGVTGSVAVAWPRNLFELQTQLTRSGWHNSWHFAGQSGGDAFGSAGWTCLTLPTDFVLLYQNCEVAGQHSRLLLADKTGTVCVPLEDLGADTDIALAHSAAALSNERAFIGNSAFPLNMKIVGKELPYTKWRDMSSILLVPSRRQVPIPMDHYGGLLLETGIGYVLTESGQSVLLEE